MSAWLSGKDVQRLWDILRPGLGERGMTHIGSLLKQPAGFAQEFLGVTASIGVCYFRAYVVALEQNSACLNERRRRAPIMV